MISARGTRWQGAAIAVAALASLIAVPRTTAQSLSVLPVNIYVSPGQNATSMTITNSGEKKTVVQIRPYEWNQKDGTDQLVDTNEVLLSPPLVTLAPGASQVVRLILRHPPKDHEATYRILVDQIPPPETQGTVSFVLRLSIPIFAVPPVRCAAKVQFRLEHDGDQLYVVAMNTGTLHEAVRDFGLTTLEGRKLKVEITPLFYLLPGVTRRWHIVAEDPVPLQTSTLRLTGHMNANVIDQQVQINGGQ